VSKELGIGIAATVLIAAGTFAAGAFLTAAEDAAIELAPRDTIVYANAFLNPATSQKQAIRDLLENFPRANTPEKAESELDDLLNQLFAAEQISWTEDVKPWLGDQIAAFVSAPNVSAAAMPDPPVAFMIETEDENATRALLQKLAEGEPAELVQDRSYEGVDYLYNGVDGDAWGIVEGFLVGGTDAGFKKAVDATQERSLADSERFENALAPLTDRYVALMYFDAKPMFDAIEESGQIPPGFFTENAALAQAQRPAAAVMYARSDAIVVDAFGSAGAFGGGQGPSSDEPSGLLGDVPQRSWLGVGVTDLGGTVRRAFQSLDSVGFPGMATGFITQQLQAETGLDLERDILSWMGDFGGFVRGTSPTNVDGGIVFEVTDRQAAAAALLKFRQYLRRQGAPIKREASGFLGFTIQDQGMPQPIHIALGEQRLAVAYGDDATAEALGSPSTLGSDSTFRDARARLGDGFAPALYIEIQQLIGFIREGFVDAIAQQDALGFPDEAAESRESLDRFDTEVMPNLEPFKFVVAGSKTEGDAVLQRLVIGVG
jgi:hypothetical protein